MTAKKFKPKLCMICSDWIIEEVHHVRIGGKDQHVECPDAAFERLLREEMGRGGK